MGCSTNHEELDIGSSNDKNTQRELFFFVAYNPIRTWSISEAAAETDTADSRQLSIGLCNTYTGARSCGIYAVNLIS